MKWSIKGTSIIESIVVMLIVVTWVVGMYTLYINSQKIAQNTNYRVAAIAMAREWIEAVTNIRDTNWYLFPANTDSCWMTHDYNGACLSGVGTFIPAWSYTLFLNSDNRWTLSWSTTWSFSDAAYRTRFEVKQDPTTWLYTQSGWVSSLPLFTREIKISYPSWWAQPQAVKVESIVQWIDSSKSNGNFRVDLETLLTNWKDKR